MKDRYPDDFNTQTVYDDGYGYENYGRSPYDREPNKGDFAWVKTPEDVMDAVGELQRFADVLKEKRWSVDQDIDALTVEAKKIKSLEEQVNAEAFRIKEQIAAITGTLTEIDRTRHELNIREMELDDQRKKLIKANVDPIQALDEILLQLELEEDPAQILKYMKQRREDLEPKW